MSISQKNMWLCCMVASSVLALATAAGQEYLPPSKGYNYEPPQIPFPTNGNGNKPPAPPVSRPPPPPPQRPTYIPPPPGPPAPSPQPHSHDHDDHEHHHHHEPGMPFDFAYAVNEDGNDYSHNAVSDGDVTRGQYRVALPDGRTQVVKYTADWKNGFNAEVTYEGEAQYPEQPSGGYGQGNGGSSGQAYAPPSQGGGYQY